ncbi:uncharacterized protein [Narcine bancroftii]|uniref:uncharacterized protein n=1 Tax=Narcine bancroftii TaxID=1343680 RepID=UPI0038322B5E
MERRDGGGETGWLMAIFLTLLLPSSVEAAPRSRRESDLGCASDQFWNEDVARCLDCALCQKQEKTPGCEICPKSCGDGSFWNTDNQQCISCKICKSQPKTPQCDTCINKDVAATPQPEKVRAFPLWTWLIVVVVLVVSLPIGIAWYRTRFLHTSTVAKPVQEIGTGDSANQQMLGSD